MIEKICLQCGKSFKICPSEAKRRIRKFCSHNCYVQWRTSNNKGGWGKGRFRSNDFKEKVSQTRKRLFAEGKLISPTLGLKRPDLAERNRRGLNTTRLGSRVFTQEVVEELFQEYSTYKGGLRGFAKSKGYKSGSHLREIFHRFIPSDRLDFVMESKKAQNNRYAIGRRFEWRVRDYFKENGYFVLRSPRSAGPVDLIAIRKDELLFIQCKTDGWMSHKDKEKLYELSQSVGAKPLLAWRGLAPYYPLRLDPILIEITNSLEKTEIRET